jgi:hypothetical protein
MTQPVTIAHVRTHGVRQLLVYCNGKRAGDWPCHHQGILPVDRFRADEAIKDIERRCRSTACGWRRADLRPDYSRQQAARQSVGWMPPGRRA